MTAEVRLFGPDVPQIACSLVVLPFGGITSFPQEDPVGWKAGGRAVGSRSALLGVAVMAWGGEAFWEQSGTRERC